MTDESMLKIINEIDSKDWEYWKDRSVTEFIRSFGITINKEFTNKILHDLIDRDIFGFLYAISKLLEETASNDNDFVDIIQKAGNKIRNDLAQGPFVNALISIGEKDLNLGLGLVVKLLEKDKTSSEYGALILGGVGKKNPIDTMQKIKEFSRTDDPNKILCSVKALRVMLRDSLMNYQEKAFEILEKALQNSDLAVKGECLEAFLDFYENEPDTCKKHLFNLVKEHSNFRYSIAHRFWIKPISDSKTRLELLKICSEDDNASVRQRTLYALTKLVSDYPEEIMNIVMSLVIKNGYHYGDVDYLLEELGKVNFDKAMNVVRTWLEKKVPYVLSLSIPTIVKALLSKNKKDIVLPYLEAWSKIDEKHLEYSLNILLQIISGDYEKKPDGEFIENAHSFLVTIAQTKHIDLQSIYKTEPNKVMQCAEIIHKIKYYSNMLNYQIIQENLKQFPHISNLLSSNWLKQMQTENNKTHPLLKVLSRELPEMSKVNETVESLLKAKDERDKFNQWFKLHSLLGDLLFLNNIETKIKKLLDKGFNVNNYAKNLKNEQQVDATLSEIEFITPFVDNFTVQLEPKIDTKQLDAKIEIEGQILYVEIISPRMFKPLELLEGVRGIPNRVKGKIYDEFKNQLIGLASLNQPIVVAVDVGKSEVNYEFVEDYLFGTLTFTMEFDKKTGTVVNSYSKRKEEESMHNQKPEMDLISAVICYKTRLYDNFTYRMEGKIINNPHAKVPLSRAVAKRIEEVLFKN